MTVPPRPPAVAFLLAHRADTVSHRRGTLFDHLLGTEELLRSWGCSEALCRAGLCHASYGTDGFAPFLLPVDDRRFLVDVVGAVVEATVYFYASCDRALLYPQLEGPSASPPASNLAGDRPVAFRDRFLDRTFTPTDDQLRDFVDLTLANEIEIATAEDGDLPDWAPRLVEQMAPWASAGVSAAARRLTGAAVA